MPYEQQQLPRDLSNEDFACYERPVARRYLEDMHEKILEAWNVTYGTKPHGIVARISIDRSGEIATLQIIESPNKRFASAAEEAIRSAQPFGSVPDDASCVTVRTLLLEFMTRLQP
jgi:hypothetical protein